LLGIACGQEPWPSFDATNDFVRPQANHRGLSPLRDPRLTTIKAEAAGASAASHSSGGFGGREFWQSLRSNPRFAALLNLHVVPKSRVAIVPLSGVSSALPCIDTRGQMLAS
jgi:hypothetical protein